MMKKIFCLIISILLVSNSLTCISFSDEIEDSDEIFSDVVKTDWFYDSVVFVYENNIMNGLSEHKFVPNELTTRAMIVTILYRLDGLKEVERENIFSDVSSENWYNDAVIWASTNHIVNGYKDNTFKPNKYITREELCKILYNYSLYKNYKVDQKMDLSHYKDYNAVSDYALESVEWANKVGLVRGKKKDQLAPKGNATRAEIATIFKRFCMNIILDNIERYPFKMLPSEHGEVISSVGGLKEDNYGELMGGEMDDYVEGIEIQLFAKAEEGYTFNKWISNSGGKFEDEECYFSKFTMPNHSVEIKAEFIELKEGEVSNETKSLLGLNRNKKDNDGDGLLDYFELKYLDTDPLKKDSDEDGISDADEDYDEDGLTNIKEQDIGTRPNIKDTDRDDINDYDEVYTYKLNPVNPDTDGDGLEDGDELKLGFDPLKEKTDGKRLDSTVRVEQTIDDSAISEIILESDNWLKPSISGKVEGNISKNVFIEESESFVLENNRAVSSDKLEITTKYNHPLTLSFYYKEKYKGDMKNLVIVHFEEDLEVFDTIIDEEKQVISTTINKGGLYLVVDLDAFLKSLGIDVLSNIKKEADE